MLPPMLRFDTLPIAAVRAFVFYRVYPNGPPAERARD